MWLLAYQYKELQEYLLGILQKETGDTLLLQVFHYSHRFKVHVELLKLFYSIYFYSLIIIIIKQYH